MSAWPDGRERLTGPQHYRRAEELLAGPYHYTHDDGERQGDAPSDADVAEAQAHATLALAAATLTGGGTHTGPGGQWAKVLAGRDL